MGPEELVERAMQARREDRPDEARELATKAVALVRAGGDAGVAARALKALGQVERDLGNAGTALSLYEEAAELQRAEGDGLGLAHTLRHVGDIHLDAGRLDRAEPYYVEALAIYRGDPRTDPLDLANAVRPYALLQERKGNPTAALEGWREARDLYATAKIEEGILECSRHVVRLAG